MTNVWLKLKERKLYTKQNIALTALCHDVSALNQSRCTCSIQNPFNWDTTWRVVKGAPVATHVSWMFIHFNYSKLLLQYLAVIWLQFAYRQTVSEQGFFNRRQIIMQNVTDIFIYLVKTIIKFRYPAAKHPIWNYSLEDVSRLEEISNKKHSAQCKISRMFSFFN